MVLDHISYRSSLDQLLHVISSQIKTHPFMHNSEHWSHIAFHATQLSYKFTSQTALTRPLLATLSWTRCKIHVKTQNSDLSCTISLNLIFSWQIRNIHAKHHYFTIIHNKPHFSSNLLSNMALYRNLEDLTYFHKQTL